MRIRAASGRLGRSSIRRMTSIQVYELRMASPSGGSDACFRLYWRGVSVFCHQIDDGSADVDDGAVLGEDVLADDAVDRTAG